MGAQTLAALLQLFTSLGRPAKGGAACSHQAPLHRFPDCKGSVGGHACAAQRGSRRSAHGNPARVMCPPVSGSPSSGSALDPALPVRVVTALVAPVAFELTRHLWLNVHRLKYLAPGLCSLRHGGASHNGHHTLHLTFPCICHLGNPFQRVDRVSCFVCSAHLSCDQLRSTLSNAAKQGALEGATGGVNNGHKKGKYTRHAKTSAELTLVPTSRWLTSLVPSVVKKSKKVSRTRRAGVVRRAGGQAGHLVKRKRIQTWR